MYKGTNKLWTEKQAMFSPGENGACRGTRTPNASLYSAFIFSLDSNKFHGLELNRFLVLARV
ncbi:MAG: hypothetical protein JWQ66_4066 [Mucilaginibacter sp.]|nr:hypothetical protein [Mucilaginibacter sp.]